MAKADKLVPVQEADLDVVDDVRQAAGSPLPDEEQQQQYAAAPAQHVAKHKLRRRVTVQKPQQQEEEHEDGSEDDSRIDIGFRRVVSRPLPANQKPYHLRTPPPLPRGQQASPFSSERVVVELRHTPQQPRADHLAEAVHNHHDDDDDGDGPSISPLVRQGKIINDQTGRTILMNKPTYNNLLDQGWTADLHAGLLRPPQQQRSTPRAAHAASTSTLSSVDSRARRARY